MSPGKMIQLLSGASAGNQEGVSPSWTFPRRARRPRRAARPPSLVFRRARRPRRAAPVLRPSSPAGPSTAQCRRQNDQAFPNLVSHKAKRPESPQVPRPGLPSPVPPSPVNPAPRPTRRGFQRRGPQASPLVVGGVWGRNRNAPRIFLRGSGGVFFQFGKNTSPDAAKHPWHPRLVNRPPTAGCGHPALRSSDGAGSKSRRASPAPPAIRPTPHFPSCNPERLC